MGFSISKYKRGDGLSMNVMIVAILCIVVLVVMVIIFVRGTGNAQNNLDKCYIGECVASASECCNEKGNKGVITESAGKCDSSGNKLCCAVTGTRQTCP